mmetsp:Transcript_51412/g.156245  ORF Transcript_51412/g.156245 Transcript_51412/m.156245 type:complete len:293 (+) Transcript_51412:511-1389(+)
MPMQEGEHVLLADGGAHAAALYPRLRGDLARRIQAAGRGQILGPYEQRQIERVGRVGRPFRSNAHGHLGARRFRVRGGCCGVERGQVEVDTRGHFGACFNRRDVRGVPPVRRYVARSGGQLVGQRPPRGGRRSPTAHRGGRVEAHVLISQQRPRPLRHRSRRRLRDLCRGTSGLGLRDKHGLHPGAPAGERAGRVPHPESIRRPASHEDVGQVHEVRLHGAHQCVRQRLGLAVAPWRHRPVPRSVRYGIDVKDLQSCGQAAAQAKPRVCRLVGAHDGRRRGISAADRGERKG